MRFIFQQINSGADHLNNQERQEQRGGIAVTNQRHYGELARCSTGPRTALCAMCRRSTGHSGPLRGVRHSRQRCGTVTIFYGSGSGSDLWLRFRFQLLKSYVSVSGSNF
jgi:hypothetical protein